MVTRAAHQAGPLVRALRRAGAEPILLPTIAVAPPEDPGALKAALAELVGGGYDWVLFTSANAVRQTLATLARMGHGADALGRARVAAVGPATAGALSAAGAGDAGIPGTFTGADAARLLGPGPGRVLLPRAEGARPETRAALVSAGWTCDDVTAYRTVPATPDPGALGALRRGSFDAVTFTSGSAARNFVAIAGPPAALGLAGGDAPGPVVACIGPATARAAREAGLRVDAVASAHTTEGLVAALEEALL